VRLGRAGAKGYEGSEQEIASGLARGAAAAPTRPLSIPGHALLKCWGLPRAITSLPGRARARWTGLQAAPSNPPVAHGGYISGP